MGIQDLYQLIYKHAPEAKHTIFLSDCSGVRMAVDISIFLNKFVKSAGDRLWMNTFFVFICTLKKHGIKTVCIFDGPNPPVEKIREQERRRGEGRKAVDRLSAMIELRDIIFDKYIPTLRPLSEEMQEKGAKLFGKPTKYIRTIDWSDCTQALDALNSSIDRLQRATTPITSEHQRLAKSIVEMMGLPVFQADGEAEALCAYLAIRGHVDGVLTEDTDVLAYGAPWLFALKDFKISDEKLTSIHLPTVLESTGLNQKEFTDLCILLSCDYNDRIKVILPDSKSGKETAVGATRAYDLIQEYRDLETITEMSEDPSALIYERCREIFSCPSGEEVTRLIKCVPYDCEPDFARVERFMMENRLTITSEYVRSCWIPGKLTFSDDPVEAIDEEYDFDI